MDTGAQCCSTSGDGTVACTDPRCAKCAFTKVSTQDDQPPHTDHLRLRKVASQTGGDLPPSVKPRSRTSSSENRALLSRGQPSAPQLPYNTGWYEAAEDDVQGQKKQDLQSLPSDQTIKQDQLYPEDAKKIHKPFASSTSLSWHDPRSTEMADSSLKNDIEHEDPSIVAPKSTPIRSQRWGPEPSCIKTSRLFPRDIPPRDIPRAIFGFNNFNYELSKMLQPDESLLILYGLAIKPRSFGPYNLERNLVRFIEQMARSLEIEANNEIERLASGFIAQEARSLASWIMADLFRTTQGMFKHRILDEPETNHQDFLTDENQSENLTTFRTFVVKSNAFKEFQLSLSDLIHLESSQTLGIEGNHPQTRDFTFLRSVRNSLFSILEPKTPILHTLRSTLKIFKVTLLWACMAIIAAAIGFVEFTTPLPTYDIPRSEVSATGFVEPTELVLILRFKPNVFKITLIFTCIAISFAFGFEEPQIPPDSIGFKWQCRCGHSFSGKVYECRPGGVQRLKERMQLSGCLKVTVTTDGQQQPRRRYPLQISSWIRNISRSLLSSLALMRKPPPEKLLLPQHSKSTVMRASEAGKPRKPVSQREKYLMTCMHQTKYHVKLKQELLQEINTDRQLFDFLKAQTRRNCGSLGHLLSMRRVQKIFFIKFRLHKGGVVQIRHHKYCCTQQICECIPPQSKVIKPPMGTGEYDCNPSGPPDTWPPVCPEFMMHMYHSPQCIAEDDTSILEQLPKKMDCKLDETTGVPPEGWGLYFQEDIDISTIIAVVFIVLFVASLLFLILWTILKDDIQGASGVSAYIVAVASMAGIWIATKSKSFG